MKTFFIGIDISKDELDVAVCLQSNDDFEQVFTCKNNTNGISKMLAKLIKAYSREKLWFCFEHTGNYGLLLSCLLESRELPYSAVPALEIKQSSGMTRGKTDKIDAQRIARYAAANQQKLKSSVLASKSLLTIKELLSFRAQLVKVRSQFKNSLKAHQIVQPVIEMNYIVDQTKAQIESYDSQIKELEKQIESRIKAEQELHENYEFVRSVKGVGLMLAASLLVTTKNFTAFEDPRKFNCYAGLAPFEHRSGKWTGATKTSKLRNKYLKALLFNGANSAAQFDPQLKKYYSRKKDEGKAHNSIINAIACKIVARVFATVKRQSNYVILAQ